MKKVIVFGLGDYAQVAAVYLEQSDEYTVVAFTADGEYIQKDTLLDKPVVAFEVIHKLYPPDEYEALAAVGFSRMNAARAEVYEKCKASGYTMPTHVHPTVHRWAGSVYGDNTFIFEENVIQPFTNIGSDTVIWSGNHIGHHSSIGDHVFIASHAVVSGNCTIGDYCFIGVNATIGDGVTVAPGCLIGAGALVTRDTEPDQLIKGAKGQVAKISASEFMQR